METGAPPAALCERHRDQERGGCRRPAGGCGGRAGREPLRGCVNPPPHTHTPRPLGRELRWGGTPGRRQGAARDPRKPRSRRRFRYSRPRRRLGRAEGRAPCRARVTAVGGRWGRKRRFCLVVPVPASGGEPRDPEGRARRRRGTGRSGGDLCWGRENEGRGVFSGVFSAGVQAAAVGRGERRGALASGCAKVRKPTALRVVRLGKGASRRPSPEFSLVKLWRTLSRHAAGSLVLKLAPEFSPGLDGPKSPPLHPKALLCTQTLFSEKTGWSSRRCYSQSRVGAQLQSRKGTLANAL